MQFHNRVSKIVFLMALALTSAAFLPRSWAGKKTMGPWTVQAGTKLFVQPALGAAIGPQLSVTPDYSFTGGIELPIERELKAGDTLSLVNTTAGDKAQDAWLLVERLADGGLKIRLENGEGFNYQQCVGGGVPQPGIAHGKGLGETCFTYGTVLKMPGDLQGSLIKLSLEQSLKVASPYGKLSLSLAANDALQEIDAESVAHLRLPAGASLQIVGEAAEAHQFLATDGKLLFHLAETQQGFALGQNSAVGELRFAAEFEVGPDGDSHFVREVRAGDRIRVQGDGETQDFAIRVQKANGGSLLKILPLSAERPLRRIQINDEAPITLAASSEVSVDSAGGDSGYQSSGASQRFALPAGTTAFVQSGETLQLECFTTVKNQGLDLQNAAPKPGVAGADDFANPVAPPNPDPKPGDDSDVDPAPPSGKGVVPGQANPEGTGGWSCSMTAGTPGTTLPGETVAIFFGAAVLLRRGLKRKRSS